MSGSVKGPLLMFTCHKLTTLVHGYGVLSITKKAVLKMVNQTPNQIFVLMGLHFTLYDVNRLPHIGVTQWYVLLVKPIFRSVK